MNEGGDQVEQKEKCISWVNAGDEHASPIVPSKARKWHFTHCSSRIASCDEQTFALKGYSALGIMLH
jgi:hypothetical protein